MTKDEILKRIDQLLSTNFPTHEDDELTAAIMECYQGTLTLLDKLYGLNSSQANALRKSADRAEKYAAHPAGGLREALLPVIKGTLRTLRSEVNAGLTGSLARQAAGEVMGDFLALAKEALSDGNPNAKNVAAVLVAASFEDTIRKMGETLAAVQGRPDLQDLVQALKKANILTGASVSTAVGYLRFRNDALHADWANVNEAVIGSCLAFTEALLVKHFS
jgi:hypothetical protein